MKGRDSEDLFCAVSRSFLALPLQTQVPSCPNSISKLNGNRNGTDSKDQEGGGSEVFEERKGKHMHQFTRQNDPKPQSRN